MPPPIATRRLISRSDPSVSRRIRDRAPAAGAAFAVPDGP
jgi:hypothetical protein